MNFSCNKCQRRYSITDDKVRGKTVKVRCKNCQNVISVEGPPEETEESTRVVSLADVDRLREQVRSLAEEDDEATPVALAPSAPSWEDEPTRTMPLRDTRSPWFVMVKSKQEGPLEDDALRELVASGAVTSRSYFWQQGMPDWKRGQDIPELVDLFVAPPPPAPLPEHSPLPVEQSATSWQPEPPPPSQTTWQMEPESRTPASGARSQQASSAWMPEPEPLPDPASPAPLGELFSDLDLAHSGPHAMGEVEGLDVGTAPRSEEPLASLGAEDKSRPPVENTRYFVKKAGVDRRNPPWKIALFLFLLLAVPVGVLYALTELQVVPLRVTRTDAQGNAVQQPVSVFSAEGMGELRELLLGRTKAPPPPPAPKPKAEARPAKPEPKPEAPPAGPAAQPQAEAPAEVAALYAEGEKKDVGPEVREETEVAATDSAAQSGPPQEEVARVVTRSQSAFKSCIDQALRKNPRLRTGELLVTATVGSSGKVKQVSFDRTDLNRTYLGNCIKIRARKLVFPAFSGEDVEVEIPLVLSKSM